MFDRLEEIENKYNDLTKSISDPDIIADNTAWRELMKEHNDLTPIVESFKLHKKLTRELEEAKELLNTSDDEEMRQMAKDEVKETQKGIEDNLNALKVLLLPKDPNDDKNVIVEIRQGTGGDEAALFAGVLYRMYARYSEDRRWKTEILSANENEIGGYKEIVFMIQGRGAYSRLKYESGVHRVQRVPVTESIGRIHTSAATVAVLAEADDVDIALDMDEVRIDVFRSSGHGGQSVNTTDSAVRVTHIPTGIIISCQDEKSQLKNRDKALKVLRAKLYDLELEKQKSQVSAERRSQVGTGDRSERIRTYNYPQNRVTDHRISLTLHKLDGILDGDLDEIMDSLITEDQAAQLGE